MSRHLPEFPNLEHLKKQAKALLRELKQVNADAKLTEAQHAIAREYGFASWTKLKAYIDSGGASGGSGGTTRANAAGGAGSNPGLFARFTLPARRVIFYARYWAGQQGVATIGVRQLLRGLVEEDGNLIRNLLGDGSPVERMRVALERGVSAEEAARNAPIPLSDESKRLLERAAAEADQLGHQNIGTAHFWLACMQNDGSVPLSVLHNVLEQAGLPLEEARRRILNILKDETTR